MGVVMVKDIPKFKKYFPKQRDKAVMVEDIQKVSETPSETKKESKKAFKKDKATRLEDV